MNDRELEQQLHFALARIEPGKDFSALVYSSPRETLRELVATLPETPRMIVVLRYREDLDPSEIADRIGMPVATVKSHLHRSLEMLREKLERLNKECPRI